MTIPEVDRDGNIKQPPLVATDTDDDSGSLPRHFFFAGGGTGGHIYPAMAIAEQIKAVEANSAVSFFVSERPIDSQILSKTSFDFVTLPAKGFSLRPDRFLSFVTSQLKSYKLARTILAPVRKKTVVIGVGGFVSAPVVLAAHKLKIPIAMLNVDIVPGRANKFLARFAHIIFVQFPETTDCFVKTKAAVQVTGCPLRSQFDRPDKEKTISELALDRNKKTLLVTGASSGSASINSIVCGLLDHLRDFADNWQIVHLIGRANHNYVETGYSKTKISHKLVIYYDDMPNLLAASDLVIARAGAVSVAEYAAAVVPAIFLPYPYHKDRHQYLNARKLEDAGAAIIVEDTEDAQQTAKTLCKHLLCLMGDDEKLRKMGQSAISLARLDAAEKIAEELISMSN